MAHQDHNPQFGYDMPMGNAAIAGPVMLTGVGCAISIPLITVLIHYFFHSSLHNSSATDVGFIEFPTPIHATPDNPTVGLRLYSVETSADTTPAIAFMDALEAYEKEQEKIRLETEAEDLAAHVAEAKAKEVPRHELQRDDFPAHIVFLHDLFITIFLSAAIFYLLRFLGIFGPIKERISVTTDFLKWLCVAMITRNEPDMETLILLVQKGMMKDSQFHIQMASNPEFLTMVMKQPVFVALIEEKAKHYHDREFAQFKANIINPILKRVVAVESQFCEGVEKQSSLINEAIVNFQKDHIDRLDDDCRALKTLLDKAADHKNIDHMIDPITKGLGDLEKRLNSLTMETSADKELSTKSFTDIINTVKEYEAKINLFNDLSSKEKVEDLNLVKRLFMITYQDHATATRFAKATEGKKGTDKLHAVVTAHIETLSIMMHEVKRKIEPPASNHGQPSAQNYWGLQQPNFMRNAGAGFNGQPNMFVPGNNMLGPRPPQTEDKAGDPKTPLKF